MKKTEHDKLWESVMTTQAIICTNCGRSDEQHEMDDIDAATFFQNAGWRATKFNRVYCPECASKKLKT